MAWVRTQDRTEIIDCRAFAIMKSERYNQWLLVGYHELSNTNYAILGTFISKDDALKELDRLESWLRSGNIIAPVYKYYCSGI